MTAGNIYRLGKVTLAAVVFMAATLDRAETLKAATVKDDSSDKVQSAVWHAVISDLHAQGLRDELLPESNQIEIPAGLARADETSLQVSSFCWNPQANRAHFQMQCTGGSKCLPFLVYVSGRSSVSEESPAANPAKENLDDFFRASTKLCRAGYDAGTSVKSSGHSGLPRANSKLTIRAGEQASAIFTSTGLRVRASVTCLARGAVGDVIRVRSPNGQTFRARILGPKILEALL